MSINTTDAISPSSAAVTWGGRSGTNPIGNFRKCRRVGTRRHPKLTVISPPPSHMLLPPGLTTLSLSLKDGLFTILYNRANRFNAFNVRR